MNKPTDGSPQVPRKATPCIPRRAASSAVRSPDSSPENSPPSSPRSTAASSADLLDDKFVSDGIHKIGYRTTECIDVIPLDAGRSARGWEPGPSILVDGNYAKKDLHVNWPTDPVQAIGQFEVHDYTAWHESRRPSSLVKDALRARKLKAKAKVCADDHVDRQAIALARACCMALVCDTGRGLKWPVAWTDGYCIVYHPPEDGIHNAQELRRTTCAT